MTIQYYIPHILYNKVPVYLASFFHRWGRLSKIFSRVVTQEVAAGSTFLDLKKKIYYLVANLKFATRSYK